MKEFKGLFKDTSYLKNPPGTWQEAKNILMTKQYNSPLNENGTKFNHLIEGEVCGKIESNNEIVYFSVISNATYDSLISIYNYATKEVTQALKGNFNFKNNRPIEGVYKYDYKGSLIVAWLDGVFSNSNTPKIAKITNTDLPLNSENVLADSKIPLIELFPNIIKGTIEAFKSEGNIDGVICYVTFNYGNKNEETHFKPLNTYTYLKEVNKDIIDYVPKGVRVELKDLDYTIYDYVKIGLYIKGEEKDAAYVSKRISLTDASLSLEISSLSIFERISVEEILLPKERFVKGETITLHKDSIFIGNTVSEEDFKFQKYANLLELRPAIGGLTGSPSTDYVPSTASNERFLMFDEVYSFNIQLELHNGSTTSWYHIPNLLYDNSEFEDIWGTSLADDYALALNNFNPAVPIEQFKLENKGNYYDFGLWANKELYPNEDEYNSTIDYDGNILNGKDLRGERITYHRVMEDTYSNIRQKLEASVVVVGACITNFDSIPLSVRKQIKNVRLGVVKRSYGNSLVVSSGFMAPVSASIEFDIDGNDTITDDLPDISVVKSSPFLAGGNDGVNTGSSSPDEYLAGFSFDRVLFHSPELETLQPILNFNLTKVYHIMCNDGVGTNSYGALTTFQNFSMLDETWVRESNLNPNTDNALEDFIKVNKYYNNKFSYQYKLPNNQAQGSTYMDGGLYINYNDNSRGLAKTGKEFMPLVDNLATVVIDDYTKVINLDIQFAHAPIGAFGVLLNIQDNLYNLKATTVISSKNTITLSNDTISDEGFKGIPFFVGDVGYAVFKGGIKYRESDTVYRKDVFIKTVSSLFPCRWNNKDNHEGPYGTYALREWAVEDIELLNAKPYGYENKSNERYLTLNDLGGYPTYDIYKEFINLFPYRIIRSNLAPSETFIINSLRTFYATAYYELVNNKGDIVALRANDDHLYIQLRYSLLFAEVKDVLTTVNVDAYLETRDLFDRDPKAITSDPKGYIGSEHKFACKITKNGYITIDHLQGNIVLATPEVKILSMAGLRNELREELEFDNTYREEVNGILKIIDNPYQYTGFSVGVDEGHNRLFISKLYPYIDNGEVEDRIAYYKELVNEVPPSADTPIVIDNFHSFTLSFSLDFNSWVCYHDFVACMFIGFKRTLYALKNVPYGSTQPNMATIHAINKGKKGMYFGLHKESYVDLIFNSKSNLSKSLYNIDLITESYLKRHSNLTTTDKTISKIFVFSDNQASEILELDLTNKDIIRYVEGSYRINNLRDILADRDLPILNERGEIIESNLNYNKNWFDKSYFIGKFIVIRLIWSNDVQDDIYVNEVNIISQISKR